MLYYSIGDPPEASRLFLPFLLWKVQFFPMIFASLERKSNRSAYIESASGALAWVLAEHLTYCCRILHNMFQTHFTAKEVWKYLIIMKSPTYAITTLPRSFQPDKMLKWLYRHNKSDILVIMPYEIGTNDGDFYLIVGIHEWRNPGEKLGGLSFIIILSDPLGNLGFSSPQF